MKFLHHFILIYKINAVQLRIFLVSYSFQYGFVNYFSE